MAGVGRIALVGGSSSRVWPPSDGWPCASHALCSLPQDYSLLPPGCCEALARSDASSADLVDCEPSVVGTAWVLRCPLAVEHFGPMEPPLVMTARAGGWQGDVALALGDYHCVRCRQRVAPSAASLVEPGSVFVCFTCVSELRRPGDRGWRWFRGRLAPAEGDDADPERGAS